MALSTSSVSVGQIANLPHFWPLGNLPHVADMGTWSPGRLWNSAQAGLFHGNARLPKNPVIGARLQSNGPAPIAMAATAAPSEGSTAATAKLCDAVLQSGLPTRSMADLPWLGVFEQWQQQKRDAEQPLVPQAVDAALAALGR